MKKRNLLYVALAVLIGAFAYFTLNEQPKDETTEFARGNSFTVLPMNIKTGTTHHYLTDYYPQWEGAEGVTTNDERLTLTATTDNWAEFDVTTTADVLVSTIEVVHDNAPLSIVVLGGERDTAGSYMSSVGAEDGAITIEATLPVAEAIALWQNERIEDVVVEGNHITVAIPEGTRASSADGFNLSTLASTNYSLRYIVEVYRVNDNAVLYDTCQRFVETSKNTSKVFPVRLAPGYDYRIVAWTDIVEGDSKEDRYYYTEEGDSIAFGMNTTECGYLTAYMKERQVEKLFIREQSNGVFYPVTQVPPGKDRLPNFAWLHKLRPLSKYDIMIWRGKDEEQKLKTTTRREVPLPTLKGLTTNK